MRRKSQTLISGSEEGWSWWYPLILDEEGKFLTHTSYFEARSIVERREKEEGNGKQNIRRKDQGWVFRHIPSSIWWQTEIHHDWENDGRMYLLTRGEHILKHREERRK